MKKALIVTLILCTVLPLVLSACTPAHEHTYSSEITKQPTCTATGIKTYTCTICKDSYTEEIPMTEHSFNEEITEKATCAKEGIKTKTCINCGFSEKESIPMAEHEYEEKVTKKATCTKSGSKTLTCTVCGDSHKEEIPAKGHTWTEKITTKATCTKAGKKTLTCKSCGKTKTEKIPATGHSWINATCTSAKKCSVCGKKEGKALGHNPNDNGICTRCGKDVGLITIKLKNTSLPKTIKYRGTPDVKVTDFRYEAKFFAYSTDSISLYFSGECVYPSVNSYECHIGYKLYDSDGYIIASGVCLTDSLSYGDKFRDCEEYISLDVKLIKGGTYYLELLNVT